MLFSMRREDNTPARVRNLHLVAAAGNAPERNLIIKRARLREAFRLMQHEVIPGVDFLAVVKPHKPLDVGVRTQAKTACTQLMNG